MNPNLKWKALFHPGGDPSLHLWIASGLPTFPTSVAQVKGQFSSKQIPSRPGPAGRHAPGAAGASAGKPSRKKTDQMLDPADQAVARQEYPLPTNIRRVDDTHILVRNVDSNQVAAFRGFRGSKQYGGAQWEEASRGWKKNFRIRA